MAWSFGHIPQILVEQHNLELKVTWRLNQLLPEQNGPEADHPCELLESK